MFRKIILACLAIALSLGSVGVIDTGVAAAHGKNGGGGGGGPAAHGKNDGGGGGDPAAHGKNDGGGGGGPAAHGKNDGGGGPAAHGKKSGKAGGSTLFTGTTTCSIRGKLTFTPPLMSGGTASSTVTVTGLLRQCSTTNDGKVKLNNGHLSALVGTTGQNDCSTLGSVLAPPLSGGSVMWTPPSKVKGSGNVSMPAGSGTADVSGGKSVIRVSYVGGSVGSGSFANSAGSSLTLTSIQDTAQLSARCMNGLANLAFSGKATL